MLKHGNPVSRNRRDGEEMRGNWEGKRKYEGKRAGRPIPLSHNPLSGSLIVHFGSFFPLSQTKLGSIQDVKKTHNLCYPACR